jgi:hypothetical protein
MRNGSGPERDERHEHLIEDPDGGGTRRRRWMMVR